MASAESYAKWLVANEDKKGTPEFETVAQAYRAVRSRKQPEPETFDPTEGMSGWEKAAAGGGKFVTDVYRGGKQLINIGDQEALQREIDESKRLDRPLMSTGAGMAGYGGAAALSMLPAAAIPGVNTVAGSAALGAGMGALQPTASDESAATQIIGGGLLGGGSTLALRAIPTAAKALIDPFRQKGREQIVGRTLERFSNGPVQPRGAQTPGWQPTLAEATQNPGLALLERGAASADPQLGAAMAARQLEQNAAAMQAVRGIAGTPQQQGLARGIREYMTQPLYAEAAQEGIDPAVAKTLKPQIDSLLARPSIKRAIGTVKEIFGEESAEEATSGSVRGLQMLKQSMDDLIEKAGSPASSIGKNQLRALQQTRSDLVSTLQELSPKLRQADVNYAIFSRPVSEQKVGQALTEKLQPALMDFSPGVPTRLRAQQYAGALRDIEGQLPKMTGYPGATLERSVSPGAMRTLTGVAEDLASRASAADLMSMGTRGGSSTASNLASQNLLAQILGPMGMPRSWAEGVAASTAGQTMLRPVAWAARSAEQRVQEELAKALLNPAYGQQLVARLGPTQQAAQLAAALSKLRRIAPPALGIAAGQAIQE